MARTEGTISNTYPQPFEVTGSLIVALIELTHGLRLLGVQDIDGKLTYEEGEVC